MTRLYLGVDTSNYTTSVSCVSDEGIVFERRTVLSVPLGDRGLRQSEALFQHVRNLPSLMEEMMSSIHRPDVAAVGVSTKPTAAEESYMPVFLAGKLAAAAAASSLGVMLYETTHQAGHIRAAMFGQEEAFAGRTFLAMHLSGGTTDLLLVSMKQGRVDAIERIGGSTDLHAGQLVDRVGVAMGLPFPSGAHLERLAQGAIDRSVKLPSSVKGLECSFSGQETMCRRLFENGAETESVAYAVYDCLARTFSKMLKNAVLQTGCKVSLLTGGVSESRLMRKLMRERTQNELYFSPAGLGADNAAGVALMTRDFALYGR